MRAIILAAGRGSRMGSLTDQRPKCLVEFQGRPLLDWQLGALRGAGINDIAIVTGYCRELIAPWGLREFVNERWAQTNMVASLSCAAELLRDGPCIVCYSDLFYTAQGPKLLADHDADLAITFDPNWRALWQGRFSDPLSDAETFRMDHEGNVVEIGAKPKSLDDIEGQYMGLLRFSPSGWHEFHQVWTQQSEAETDQANMTGTLSRVIESGSIKIKALPYRDHWGEVDSEADLAFYERDTNANPLA